MRLGRWELRWNTELQGMGTGGKSYGRLSGYAFAVWWLGPLELWRYDV